MLPFLRGKEIFYRKEKISEGGKLSWKGETFWGVRLLTCRGEKMSFPKKGHQKIEGNEVKYSGLER